MDVTSLEQLERPLPPGIRCRLKRALRQDDDGTEFNRVKTFEVVGIDEPETDPFAPGSEITYQIYFANWSVYSANDVRVIVTLPEHTTYVSSSGPGFVLVQAGPTQVDWFKDHLTGFELGWLSVAVRVNNDAPVGAGVETKAEIYCSQSESDYSNNESIV